jgi:hypothetical protein
VRVCVCVGVDMVLTPVGKGGSQVSGYSSNACRLRVWCMNTLLGAFLAEAIFTSKVENPSKCWWCDLSPCALCTAAVLAGCEVWCMHWQHVVQSPS